ncbi:MAG: hypothetical protein IT256_03210, partial [Chitinophagaceae bacterium]|nr:hypothetical protein [Chitinophagaceae bacterium]
IVVLGIVEVKDNVLFLKEKCNEKNPFANAALCISQPPHIDFAKYQCLLPFPYFLQGSEDYSMTFDDENGFSTMIMQLSLYNHMPTMACKLGRTPPIFSKYLIDFVGYDIISDSLRSMLNNKPILIVCDPQKLKDTNSTYQPDPNIFPIARKSYMATTTFIERHQLIPIDSLNGILYYEYLVPKK